MATTLNGLDTVMEMVSAGVVDGDEMLLQCLKAMGNRAVLRMLETNGHFKGEPTASDEQVADAKQEADAKRFTVKEANLLLRMEREKLKNKN